MVRKEDVQIKMKLDGKTYQGMKENISALAERVKVNPSDSDEVILHYAFCIEYFGTVVESLEAVKILCEHPNVVTEANCQILEEGKILAYEVFKALETIIIKLNYWRPEGC